MRRLLLVGGLAWLAVGLWRLLGLYGRSTATVYAEPRPWWHPLPLAARVGAFLPPRLSRALNGAVWRVYWALL